MSRGLHEFQAVPLRLVVVSLCAALGAACASRLALPTGPGTPSPDSPQLYADATAGCRNVRTFSAELALSGRAEGRRIRSGRVLVGLTVPDAVYMDAPAPLGQSAFILGAVGDRGTLVMPRDGVAVADAPVSGILDALVGLELGPANLRALLTGCVAPQPRPTGGRAYAGWVAVDLEGGAVAWLRRQDGFWRVVAGEDAGLLVEYSEYTAAPAATPRGLRVRTVAPAVAVVDLRLALSQVQINVPLDPRTFLIEVPPGTALITLDQLRTRALLER